MNEAVWRRQSELSPRLDLRRTERERSVIRRKQIEMARARKGENIRRKIKEPDAGKEGISRIAKCCQSCPKREIDRKAKWMDTKKDQKSKREKKGGMEGEQRTKTVLK